ncbi:Kef-type K+ transport system, membrane component KefB [Lachnospiraceae bacterium XBB1006]|nr:Kef-type K+ transport system, membrane component KefB [Lachnospiraceae bacterium XBB1006]
MESYSFLLYLAIILASTKILGLVSEKINMPQVVGALIAGIVLGPSGFGVLESTDFFVKVAEIGVIMLMFTAGIDTDLNELKKTGFQSFVVAMMGVLVPLLLCGGLYFFFFHQSFTTTNVLRAAFVGAVFSATSVGITVETLNEMGRLKTRTGTLLLSAALIDDIIGIIVLSVLTGFSSGNSSVLVVVIKICLFFVFVGVMALIFHKVFSIVSEEHWHSRRVAIWALAFCLTMAYCAEHFFGVADITGAYFAGLILCNITKSRQFVAKKMTVSSYMLFTPVFFASVGMKTNLRVMNKSILIFALLLILAAIISKIIGCGLGAKVCKLSNHQSLVVGIGMVARSEVALMVAQKGIDAGMIDPKLLPAIIVSVIASALSTPVLLKMAINRGPALE